MTGQLQSVNDVVLFDGSRAVTGQDRHCQADGTRNQFEGVRMATGRSIIVQ